MPSASEIRSSVSTVGILSSPSTKLTVCRLSPARAERRFSESFCCNRSSLSRRAISEQIRVRNISSATHHHYKKQRLTKDATRVAYLCMFTRKLGSNAFAAGSQCQGGCSCPGILELTGGDFAVIGSDITEEAAGKLPDGSGCGPGERVVRIPRNVLVMARPDIPASL